MNIVRFFLIVLTQLPLLLYLAGSHDLLFGFNRTDAGFSLLVLLFLAVPMLNLAWLVTESVRASMVLRTRGAMVCWQGPLLALVFLVEALAIDLYLLTQVRM